MHVITHRTETIANIHIFIREAGPKDAPVLVLPHGYPHKRGTVRNDASELADEIGRIR